MPSGRQVKQITQRFSVRRLTLLLFLFSGFTMPCASQTTSSIPPADRKLIEIKVTGSKRFKPEEIAAACGLPLGAIVDDEAFRKAARQLGETGVFNDISYTFSFNSSGTRLAFQVTDADKFVPAHFTDFVWFTDQELSRRIHERATLFNGELPVTGRLPDQVSDILQALLVENGIPGQVEYLRSTNPGGKVDSFDYSVANVIIRIGHLNFTGAEPEELAMLQPTAEKLSGRDYFRALLASFVQHSVLPVFHERGYLKVSCAPPEPKVVKMGSPETGGASNADVVNDRQPITYVDVTIAITPGPRYKLTGWTWSGNSNIPSETLQTYLHSKIGQPADTVQLENDLHAVQQLYGSRGFVTAVVKADAEFDDSASAVSYRLVVTEGPVYHMGELGFRGIDKGLEARLREAWKIRPGEVYDATYLKEFLPQARKLLPPSVDWEVTSHVTALPRDKTVDVDLQYSAKATQ